MDEKGCKVKIMNNIQTIVVTGGAGFIGSCIVRTLNDEGIDDIIIVDNIASTEKWKNLSNKKYREYIHKNNFLERLNNGEFKHISAIIHMGACSSTTQTNFDYLWENNVIYTQTLWLYCSKNEIPFIYASSAATYGMGDKGFSDAINKIDELRPLNAYGYSKQVFDQWSMKQKEMPPQHVGLKFFNVYGPNEYCKGSMASMVFHGYHQLKQTNKISLFRSENKYYADGEQKRDFVYVKDVCNVILYFFKHPEYSGIFNVGTGQAQTFLDLAYALFYSLGKNVSIDFFSMPAELKEKYQYYTQADISSLRNIGYTSPFFNIKQGVEDYIQNFIEQDYAIY